MTQQRRHANDNRDFSDWLRDCKELESNKVGLSIMDIDYVPLHRVVYDDDKTKSTKYFMFIEVKIKMGQPSKSEHGEIVNISNHMRGCPVVTDKHGKSVWCGYHLIQFENTTPDNGKIFLDGNEISREEFINFWAFTIDDITKYTSSVYHNTIDNDTV
jgi:hypothetical protein